jgi:hypothetical protein
MIKNDVPDEFFDWRRKQIDFKTEKFSSEELKKKLYPDFLMGIAVAFKKRGKWFALKVTSNQGPSIWEIEIVPISEAEAKEMLAFPEDWEHQVEII